jgi:hypothetical protein
MAVFWHVALCSLVDTDWHSEELNASIIRVMITPMMGIVNSFEASVKIFQTTQCNMPEDNHPSSYPLP